ncbi:hypothetical protein ACH4TP_37640 [Streptomyces sp. NPDC021012]|uniref:hypothetical protein n=1 Tax=Streptomyces sp. NPDC021012 TaxID=3365107 RepID=UPI00378C28F1
MADTTPAPRVFRLQRHTDISGVSGLGHIADGIQWPDGTVTIRWRGPRPSTVHWNSLDDALAIHGHNGATEAIWDQLTEQQRALAANAVSTALNALNCWRPAEDCRTVADAALNAATGLLDRIPTQEVQQ